MTLRSDTARQEEGNAGKSGSTGASENNRPQKSSSPFKKWTDYGQSYGADTQFGFIVLNFRKFWYLLYLPKFEKI